jgi:hypothetical protein
MEAIHSKKAETQRQKLLVEQADARKIKAKVNINIYVCKYMSICKDMCELVYVIYVFRSRSKYMFVNIYVYNNYIHILILILLYHC